MRWIWIDKFLEFESGRRAVALKNVTLAEDHLHDHFPGFPIMPECLMIEAMAQTAGILVGQANDFREKVVLAKISKAVFFDFARPGDTLRIEAQIGSIAPEAASTSGCILRDEQIIAEIDLMFSHVDQNLAGKKFPKENFVFTGLFTSLLRDIVLDAAASPAESA
ncbi:MAG: 3-hydroxyacyl-ACP dehydratase FabZ family protein [Planctomycetota bacterium]|nr:3-hydroxyacyl-ACP dehydratase FabZ family protein [Planctomycetota bacterium]